MNPRNIPLLFTCALVLVLLYGCATTKPATAKPAGAVEAADEKIPELKITEFILGPGDKVDIAVYRHDDLKKTAQVDTSGKITYPLIGDIQASGVGIFQLRDQIRDRLSKFIKDPQVSVGVNEVHSQKVTILGEVKSPGLFPIDTPLTTIEAISKAGGFTADAKEKTVLLIRGGLKNPELKSLDIKSALTKNDMAQNVYLQSGDIIYVPAKTIANVSRFFDYLTRIITPLTQIESGYFIGQQIIGGSGTASIPAK